MSRIANAPIEIRSRKLAYWVCDSIVHGAARSIRARTRREARALLEASAPGAFAPPRKVVIAYHDAFDLACKLLREGGAEHG